MKASPKRGAFFVMWSSVTTLYGKVQLSQNKYDYLNHLHFNLHLLLLKRKLKQDETFSATNFTINAHGFMQHYQKKIH